MKRRAKQEHKFRRFLGQLLPYVAVFLVILGVAKVGSEDKAGASSSSLNLTAMAESNYNVSADQLSELYVVASLSDSFSLASTDTVASNYVAVSLLSEISQTSATKIEKPSLVNTNISRGIQYYTVSEGESLASIAARFKLTTDQVRWSNGLKTTTVAAGTVLKIPTVAGITYTVKAGDTVEGLAAKYNSTAERIIAYNDLEGQALSVGALIVLPGGVLPVTERPEYVAPVRNYTYAGSSSSRLNLQEVTGQFNISLMYGNGNPGQPGQCTWFAWWWRHTQPQSLGTLPGGLSHARYWATTSSITRSFRVDRTPAVGAVFQTTSGTYGHVGVVTGVNADGSIEILEMNFIGPYRIDRATIPANMVGNFNYIH